MQVAEALANTPTRDVTHLVSPASTPRRSGAYEDDPRSFQIRTRGKFPALLGTIFHGFFSFLLLVSALWLQGGDFSELEVRTYDTKEMNQELKEEKTKKRVVGSHQRMIRNKTRKPMKTIVTEEDKRSRVPEV